MAVYIISDTHIPDRVKAIPKKFLERLTPEDIVLHAGDFTTPVVLEELRRRAKVHAVWGNMDGPEVRKELPRKTVVTLGKVKIGLYHGHGAPEGLVDRVRAEFTEPVDIIVFGHSHTPFSKKFGATLLFNPGSLSINFDRRTLTYGRLQTDPELHIELVEIP